MLYLDYRLDRVRLTKHLRGTRECEQKKKFLFIIARYDGDMGC